MAVAANERCCSRDRYTLADLSRNALFPAEPLSVMPSLAGNVRRQLFDSTGLLGLLPQGFGTSASYSSRLSFSSPSWS